MAMLGDTLVKSGAITQQQLDEALKIQNANPGKKLGEILIEKGFTTQEKIEKALLS